MSPLRNPTSAPNRALLSVMRLAKLLTNSFQMVSAKLYNLKMSKTRTSRRTKTMGQDVLDHIVV